MSSIIYFKRELSSLVYEQVTPTEIIEALVNGIGQLREELAQTKLNAEIYETRYGTKREEYKELLAELAQTLTKLTQADRRIEVLEQERNEWRADWREISARLLNERRRNAMQLANIREAVDWLWGFWVGNSLRAVPGFEDDIREAWDRLLAAVE